MSIDLKHAPFLESTNKYVFSYMPSFTHGIKDAQNNCYVPAAGPGGCSYAEGDFTNTYCCNEVKEKFQTDAFGNVSMGYQCAAEYQAKLGAGQ